MLKMCSVVLLFGRKSACSSDISCSALPLSRFIIMSEFVHSSGQVLVSQIFWHMIMNASIIASPPCLICSAGTLSTSGDVCVFSTRIASSTSARRMVIYTGVRFSKSWKVASRATNLAKLGSPTATYVAHLLINTLKIENKYFGDRMFERHQQQIKTSKTNSFETFCFKAGSIQCNI